MVASHILVRVVELARQSNEEFKVGAILFRKKVIISEAYNDYSPISYRRKYFAMAGKEKGVSSRHAEMKCLHSLTKEETKGLDIIVVRVWRKDGSLSCAKPCFACAQALHDHGIKRIYYTDWDGQLKKIKLSLKELENWNGNNTST